MTKYISDGNLKVVWVPGANGIADADAPTTTELNAGIDISCDVATGGYNPGVGSGTVDGGSICSGAVQQNTGRSTSAPRLTCYRKTQAAGDSAAWGIAVKHAVGWLVVRTGIPSDTVWADGQEVTVGKYEQGEPIPQHGGGDTNATFEMVLNLLDGATFDQHANVGGVS